MSKFKPQHRRLLKIHERLRERVYPNCASLAAELEVSGKTIQRDLEYLRDEQDAPIAYDAVEHGYYYTESNFSLPAINISESELFTVCIAQTVLCQFRNTPLFQRLSSVFEKIRDSLVDRTTVHPSWMDERILVFPEPATRVDADIWDTMAKAIRGNRRLAIRHSPPGGSSDPVLERKVDPYYLVSHKGQWYLSSFCHQKGAIRTFGVSRISHARVLDEAFAMPVGMTKDLMFGDQFGIIWKAKRHRVRIRFEAGVAPFIREREWHPAQRIRERRDGGLILEFTTNHLNEVKDWVLRWGDGCTALAPRALVARVKEGLEGALRNYGPRHGRRGARARAGAAAAG